MISQSKKYKISSQVYFVYKTKKIILQQTKKQKKKEQTSLCLLQNKIAIMFYLRLHMHTYLYKVYINVNAF